MPPRQRVHGCRLGVGVHLEWACSPKAPTGWQGRCSGRAPFQQAPSLQPFGQAGGGVVPTSGVTAGAGIKWPWRKVGPGGPRAAHSVTGLWRRSPPSLADSTPFIFLSGGQASCIQRGAVLSCPGGECGESLGRNADPRARPGRPVPPGCRGRGCRKGSGHPEECGGVSTYCRPRGNLRRAGSRGPEAWGGSPPAGQQAGPLQEQQSLRG